MAVTSYDGKTVIDFSYFPAPLTSTLTAVIDDVWRPSPLDRVWIDGRERNGAEFKWMEWNGMEYRFHSIVWIFYNVIEQGSYSIVWIMDGIK